MNLFYSKFAFNNLLKNKRFLVPYVLSAIFTIICFYILSSLSYGGNLDKLEHGASAVKRVLGFGVIVIGIFSVIFLFYTYSFLIKRRVKEFGLYSVLGMTKKQIARILVLETIYIAVVTIGLGLVLGIVLDKLALLALLKLFTTGVSFGFVIAPKAIVVTALLFGGVYFLLLIYTIIKISRLKIVALLKESSKGEKEPKARWLLAIIGLGLIGYGYYTAQTVTNPIKAVTVFFFAVIAVIIGTYFIFVAVSITVLKIMKNNKGFYYKPKNFISVSGLLYRMKRNAVGLANICILATMILVTMGTTSALYAGSESSFEKRYPRDIAIMAYNQSDKEAADLEKNIEKIVKENNTEIKDLITYNQLNIAGTIEGSNFSLQREFGLGSVDKVKFMTVITLDDYNKVAKTNKTLKSDEILLYVDKKGTYDYNQLNINGDNLKVKEKMSSFPGEVGSQTANITDTYYVVVKDKEKLNSISARTGEAFKRSDTDDLKSKYITFDLGDKNKEEIVVNKLKNLENSDRVIIERKSESKVEFIGFFASFLFIGIFISMVFVVSQVVIMYYKQISEGYEDKDKFEIMRKVGLTDKQIKQSIRAQVLLIFFAPLVVATIHTIVAYPFIEKILKLFLLSETRSFLIAMFATISIFALFYLVVYTITSKTYYRIIKEK